MIVLKIIGKMFYWLFMLTLYMMVFPLWLIGKLFFWWLPSDNDSYEKDDDEWLFWKGHGHDDF